ncbi:MAG: recombinase family protein [Akkermansiaceae bacterium]
MQKTPVPVAILVRVSTSRQETDRQVSELRAYAESREYQIVEICEEQVSGAALQESRNGLIRAEELARSGTIRKVLVHEVSRLARRNSVAHAFVEMLEELGVSLYWHQQSIETLLPNGKRNPAASLMFALLAEMARAERETLSERIRSGLAEARRKGKKLGRPKGSILSMNEFLSKHKDICRILKQGHSVRNTAKITNKGISTVQRVKAKLVF